MKIGFVLGVGVVRGWIYIGIIEVLEKFGVKIDVVVGCFIGVYVGVVYVSGKLEGLKEWVCFFSDWQVFVFMGVGFRCGGIVSGQKVFDKLVSEFCELIYEDMFKLFVVVVIDFYIGCEVVFNFGFIGDII